MKTMLISKGTPENGPVYHATLSESMHTVKGSNCYTKCQDWAEVMNESHLKTMRHRLQNQARLPKLAGNQAARYRESGLP